MSFNKAIVEDAPLEWFLLRQGYGGQVGELVPQAREVGHGAAFALLRRAKPYPSPGEHAGGTLTPALSHGERGSDIEVVLVGRLREAIRRLNPAIPEDAREEALRKVLRVRTPALTQTNRAFRRMPMNRRLSVAECVTRIPNSF